jgi:hypothetical protein
MNKVIANPFPHLVVDDFLPAHLLNEICEKLKMQNNLERHPAGYEFEALFHEELTRFLYRFVRSTIQTAFGISYTWSKIYKLPQIYRIAGPWQGLAPHTDNQEGRDLAMIIYLARDWCPSDGGELQLFEKSEEKIKPIQTIEPIFNRAVFFPLGPDSWHAVKPILSDWKRLTIIQDWQC